MNKPLTETEMLETYAVVHKCYDYEPKTYRSVHFCNEFYNKIQKIPNLKKWIQKADDQFNGNLCQDVEFVRSMLLNFEQAILKDDFMFASKIAKIIKQQSLCEAEYWTKLSKISEKLEKI